MAVISVNGYIVGKIELKTADIKKLESEGFTVKIQ